MRRWNCYARWSTKDHFLNVCKNSGHPEDQNSCVYLLVHSVEEASINLVVKVIMKLPDVARLITLIKSLRKQVQLVSSGRFQETRFHIALVALAQKRNQTKQKHTTNLPTTLCNPQSLLLSDSHFRSTVLIKAAHGFRETQFENNCIDTLSDSSSQVLIMREVISLNGEFSRRALTS